MNLSILSKHTIVRVTAAVALIPILSGCFGQRVGMGGNEAAEPASSGQPGSPVASYVVVDFYSKKILSSHRPNTKRQVASLTKVTTAMVTLDWAERTGSSLAQLATVPPSAAQVGGANPMGMQPGDQISLREAIYASVIGSDNVAAHTLAAHVGRDLLTRAGRGADPMSVFVREMNSLANNVGASNTKFTNAHGMDHQGDTPYSTAADQARLAIYAMGKASFRFYASQKQRNISYSRQGQARSFVMKNTNKLLGVDSVDGVKTGMTNKAGPCLITSAARPNSIVNQEDGRTRVVPHRLMVVVLGAPNRFDAARSLLNRGWQKYDEWAANGRRIQNANELLDPQ